MPPVTDRPNILLITTDEERFHVPHPAGFALAAGPAVFHWVADLLGFRTLDAPRVLSVASGVVVTVATYACARRVTSRGNALLAAGLVTTSGSIMWVTGPLNCDGPSIALSVLAIAYAGACHAAVSYRRSRSKSSSKDPS